MKIIKEGDLNKLKETKKFYCRACGCVFEADNEEYIKEEQQLDVIFVCECPCCGKKCVNSHSRTKSLSEWRKSR